MTAKPRPQDGGLRDGGSASRTQSPDLATVIGYRKTELVDRYRERLEARGACDDWAISRGRLQLNTLVKRLRALRGQSSGIRDVPREIVMGAAPERSIAGEIAELYDLRAVLADAMAEANATADEVRTVQDELEDATRRSIAELERQAASALARAASAERDLEQQGRMLGVVAHDLRSPIATIAFTAGGLERRSDLSDETRASVQRILAAVDRMGRMSADLADISRARCFQPLRLTRAAASLDDVCRATIADVLARRPACVVTFEQQGDCRGEWDAARIGQVVDNLVSNALDYSTAGAPVSVVVASRGLEVSLAVHNQGPPIAANEREAIFEPFCMGSQAGRKAGEHVEHTGLGLFIVRQIVEAHGGAIAVRSSAEDGTMFEATLPTRGS